MMARAQDFAPMGTGLQHGGRGLALSAAERPQRPRIRCSLLGPA